MALTVTLAPLNGKIGVKKTQKFTATPAGAAEGAVLTYEWFVDGAVIPGETASTCNYTANILGDKTIKVVATATVGEEAPETAEATTTLTVEKNKMTLTATASTTTPTVRLGETYMAQCDVTGNPAGSVVSYKWSSGETDKVITKASTAIGEITLTCDTTVTHPDYDTATKTSNAIKITVDKKLMTDVVSTASTTTPTIPFGSAYTAKVVLTGQPAGSVVAHEWSNGQFGDTAAGTADSSQPIKLKCSTLITHEDYEDFTIESNEVTITVTKIDIPVSIQVKTDKTTYTVGETVRASVTNTEAPAGSNVTILWSNGASSSIATYPADTVGDLEIECTVTFVHPDYNETVKTQTVTVTVEEEFDPAVDAVYVHPLPHRNSAYIWSGWWVMDEIERLTKGGIDWKTAPADSPYSLHLKVLAKMLIDFPEVDVQESRNGRIVHRSALDVGIIY